MNWFSFVVLALATWRVSSLLVNEDGPFGIFDRIRSLHEPDSQVAEVLSCVWCTSIYVGAFWTILFFVSPLALWFAIPFALSCITIVVHLFVERLKA